MSSSEPPHLSPRDATRKIRLILEDGTIDYSGHCWRVRMPERNVSTLDVEHVLRQGRVIREPEWAVDYRNWKYRVEGADIEGDELTAIAVIFRTRFLSADRYCFLTNRECARKGRLLDLTARVGTNNDEV